MWGHFSPFFTHIHPHTYPGRRGKLCAILHAPSLHKICRAQVGRGGLQPPPLPPPPRCRSPGPPQGEWAWTWAPGGRGEGRGSCLFAQDYGQLVLPTSICHAKPRFHSHVLNKVTTHAKIPLNFIENYIYSITSHKRQHRRFEVSSCMFLIDFAWFNA